MRTNIGGTASTALALYNAELLNLWRYRHMCSIMGYCSRSVALDVFKKGFEKTISRGPDDSRIIDTGDGFLGFHRLAIMGLTPSGMQPFKLEKSYPYFDSKYNCYSIDLVFEIDLYKIEKDSKRKHVLEKKMLHLVYQLNVFL